GAHQVTQGLLAGGELPKGPDGQHRLDLEVAHDALLPMEPPGADAAWGQVRGVRGIGIGVAAEEPVLLGRTGDVPNGVEAGEEGPMRLVALALDVLQLRDGLHRARIVLAGAL